LPTLFDGPTVLTKSVGYKIKKLEASAKAEARATDKSTRHHNSWKFLLLSEVETK
jgi:hypothetical protein